MTSSQLKHRLARALAEHEQLEMARQVIAKYPKAAPSQLVEQLAERMAEKYGGSPKGKKCMNMAERALGAARIMR